MGSSYFFERQEQDLDKVAADIIRPGPKPEERECYVMAQELRDHSTHLKALVADILAVEEEDGG